jgi:hypothetical protein
VTYGVAVNAAVALVAGSAFIIEYEGSGSVLPPSPSLPASNPDVSGLLVEDDEVGNTRLRMGERGLLIPTAPASPGW